MKIYKITEARRKIRLKIYLSNLMEFEKEA